MKISKKKLTDSIVSALSRDMMLESKTVDLGGISFQTDDDRRFYYYFNGGSNKYRSIRLIKDYDKYRVTVEKTDYRRLEHTYDTLEQAVSYIKKVIEREPQESNSLDYQFIDRFNGVDRNKLYDYLSENGYKVVSALYRGANHNRQSYQFVFSNGETYCEYSRICSSGLTSGGTMSKVKFKNSPFTSKKSILDKITSYDITHDIKSEPEYFSRHIPSSLL